MNWEVWLAHLVDQRGLTQLARWNLWSQWAGLTAISLYIAAAAKIMHWQDDKPSTHQDIDPRRC